MTTEIKTTQKYHTWQNRPTYTIQQSAKLVGTTGTTVRRWLYGSNYPKMEPVFSNVVKNKEQKVEVSFLQLAELVVVGRFRKKGVKLERLRQAHEYAYKALQIEYPFAWLKLKTEGTHILSEFQEKVPGQSLLALDMKGQLSLPGDVLKALELFDYEGDFASRWYPISKTVPIVIDPRFGAGKPTIPDRRLTIETIFKRFKSGQSIQLLSEDLAVSRDLIEESVRYAQYAV